MRDTRAPLSFAHAALWLALAAGALVMVFPIYWMFATAVRPHAEIFESMVPLLPTHVAWDAFAEIWRRHPLLTWIWNSTFIAVVGVAITVSINLLIDSLPGRKDARRG